MDSRSSLSLQLMGEMALMRAGAAIALPPSKKTRALLGYLAATGKPHRRERLCDVFWDLPDDPRGALRWSLSKLRGLVDEPGRPRIVADRETVALDAAGAAVDALVIREALRDGVEALRTERLIEVERLFGGIFLDGLELPNCPDFSAWCMGEREQFRASHAAVLWQLVARLGESRPDRALPYAQRLIERDPDNEEARGEMMRLSALASRPAVPPQALAGGLAHALAASRAAAAVSPCVPATLVPSPERKFLSVLVARITADGNLPDPDPEAALAQLDPAVERMASVVEGFGGTLSSCGADGLVALFGAPVAYEDHAARACQAACALRDGLRRDDAGLQVRVGIHSGEAVVRSMGEGSGQRFEAVGQPVTVATVVPGVLEPGEIGLTSETLRRAEGFVVAVERGPLPLPGTREPLRLYRLEGLTSARSRWEAGAARGLTPFIGREVEIAKMSRALSRARAGRGEAIAIVGEPGMGKSRIVHEFVRSDHAAGWLVVQTRGRANGRQAPGLPIADLLRAWCEIDDSLSQSDVTERLRDRVLALDPALSTLLPALSAALGLPVDEAEWVELGSQQRRRRKIEAIKALLLQQARAMPLMLVFEDTHWFDDDSRGALDVFVAMAAASRLCLIFTFRPEFEHDWSSRSYFRLIRADPLSDEEVEGMLRSILGDGPHHGPLRRQLAERTGGNPLFLEEAVRALVETGELVGERGRYHIPRRIERFEIPLTIRALLAARIDRLPATAKHVLQVAAVIGSEVPVRLLAAVDDTDEDALHDALATLQSAEFLFETRVVPDQTFTFKHALTREVAYSGVLRERRRAIHAQVVLTLERHFGDRLGEQIVRIARHARRGELWDRAVEYYLRAAEDAKNQCTFRNAARFAERALEAVSADPELERRRAEVLCLQGDLASLMGRLDEANRRYEEALDAEPDAGKRAAISNKRHRPAAVERDGGRVVYYTHGAGDRTIVFVHSLVFGLATFQTIVERLCQEFRIVTVDPRGTGASDPLPGHYDLDDHVRDYCAVLDAVSDGTPVTAVGVSCGVNLIVRLVVQNPNAVDRIVLVGGKPRQTLGLGIEPEGDTEDARLQRRFLAALEACEIRAAMELIAPVVFSEPGTEDLQEQFVQQCVDLPVETIMNFFTYDPKADIGPLLPRVTAPTLVLHGTDDRDAPIACGLQLAENIPGALFYPFEGSGHLPTFTATTEFCAVLRGFARFGALPQAQLPPAKMRLGA